MCIWVQTSWEERASLVIFMIVGPSSANQLIFPEVFPWGLLIEPTKLYLAGEEGDLEVLYVSIGIYLKICIFIADCGCKHLLGNQNVRRSISLAFCKLFRMHTSFQ